MYLYTPNGFTRKDMEAELKAMIREAMQAEARACGLWVGVEQLKRAMINDVLEEKNINKGDKCVIRFTEGDEKVEFVKVERSQIYVRVLGSNGKFKIRQTAYDYTVVDFMEKIIVKE